MTITKYNYNEDFATDKHYFSDISFNKLMQKRINNVLLVCSTYDAFMLEEDGRINEKIFNEYTSLNLRYPPQFSRASSSAMAFDLLEKNHYDLVITMLNIGKVDAFELANKIKKTYPDKPIVVLTRFSKEVSLKLAKEDLSSIDYVFSWLGNTSLLLAIIKLIEDKMNADYDIEEIGAQSILLVEDSIRYYSSYLPTIYKLIFEQKNELVSEGLNDHQKTMSMRARPKILLAKTYEEAIYFFEKYKNNLLGIISDISFPKGGHIDRQAGIKLCCQVRSELKQMPILLQSSDDKHKEAIAVLRASYINKYSKTILADLRKYIKENYGFGDFIFTDPDTDEEIDRANNLHSLQVKLSSVPIKSLEYHVNNNHFSKWLKARALFPLADMFKQKSMNDFNSVEQIRSYLIDTIANYRISRGRGVIASYFDEYAIFSRIGDGMLGGKARGLAFADYLIKKHKIIHKFENVFVSIPRTVVLTTDIYDEFMEFNDLYKIATSDIKDEDILMQFIYAKLPERISDELKYFLEKVTQPIAVRSSSLLEDSHYQPFAGVYSTYMIPNSDKDILVRKQQLEIAIKSVYASVFFNNSKAYIAATANLIDEEKMAVILQEVVGSAYGQRFYPNISGVARSINFYPIGQEKTDDGIANIAFGLGKTIVEGGVSLRFCPAYPKNILQLSNFDMALKNTQKEFYALDLNSYSFKPSIDDGIDLIKLKVDDALEDGSLKYIVSTLDFQDQVIRDGFDHTGKKILTFANVLRYNIFPLADILKTLLDIGQREMNNHVEIEFAINLDSQAGLPKTFSFLQIRPIVETTEKYNININNVSKDDAVLISNSALGNGIIDSIFDIVYVKPEKYSPTNNVTIVSKIEFVNNLFVQESKPYILVGPGRWGSIDSWLGIPVKWAQISAARIIVEAGLEKYSIDPSQGTHFFQNLTSFGVGYFTINPYMNDGFYDVNWLNSFPAHYEDEFIRHVRFEKPLITKIDGKQNKAVILRPVECKPVSE
ncbi:MAG: phosphoenolpyruvate synthase [Bacteroidetes bacterium]|nr:phosphoenolpyruvate synthase [Bacteroidota bacterium]